MVEIEFRTIQTYPDLRLTPKMSIWQTIFKLIVETAKVLYFDWHVCLSGCCNISTFQPLLVQFYLRWVWILFEFGDSTKTLIHASSYFLYLLPRSNNLCLTVHNVHIVHTALASCGLCCWVSNIIIDKPQVLNNS